ncbi:2-succinyl-5-enolpyruvyl-6-hydroxy-3-cyclohexene-1-carboxylic-acid synthase [Galbitalea sp. SE-J8]|uniref:2-succinyl-5-enolpyruvyl-6-hydroxy-3- cyclohexene-1-carboxylic-acid synthase n=1 Tax=Galbitalea sp. SE-J8 TaxID=3054952 RepID=UPI00259CDBF1|nr:2-succinyl-5-enolpyruvyl-6-hydroxy-3-cyclohexene-1-carboxylic-acid synthase [Galbitalea sp. SE-J8]MDM4762408.1 2-succinyl-5-enolpyruvyl-6-hydroxy-3-cyclohexene-1-carboxylic-acid synthase [Galbitalea sp. SE-J8]
MTSPGGDFAVALLAAFVRAGVRDVVVCPGSRSQALALAAAAFETAGLIRLRVRVDERVAAFLALGIARESGAPALVVTTSGTAVANLHPAVLEAHHGGVPLIVISADRPDELRGIGANQTTEQRGIFGPAAELVDVPAPTGATTDADPAAVVARVLGAAGPVHLNVAFRDPLSGAVDLPDQKRRSDRADAAASAALAPESRGTPSFSVAGRAPLTQADSGALVEPADTPAPLAVTADEHTVVVAGAGAGPAAEQAARALGAPLLAEVVSGAHFGPNLVVDYRSLLRHPEFGGTVRRAIVFGRPTLSREAPALVQRPDVEAIVVRGPGAEDWNPGRRVAVFADAIEVAGDPAPRAWSGRWVAASRAALERHDAPPIDVQVSSEPADQAAFNRAVLADLRAPVTRRRLVEAVWRATWPHDRLVLGASRLIRELDQVAPGKRIRVHANRGLAGIDGTVATGIGVALASQAGQHPHGVTRVLLGDLALLHDAGALLVPDGEERPRIQVIVGDDHGGTIFTGLEVASTADAAAFDRVMLTPQHTDLAALAAAFGWRHVRADTRQRLEEALAPLDGTTLVEVPLAEG